jgi:hypothetical protein
MSFFGATSLCHAFLWDGAMHDIGTLGGSPVAETVAVAARWSRRSKVDERSRLRGVFLAGRVLRSGPT